MSFLNSMISALKIKTLDSCFIVSVLCNGVISFAVIFTFSLIGGQFNPYIDYVLVMGISVSCIVFSYTKIRLWCIHHPEAALDHAKDGFVNYLSSIKVPKRQVHTVYKKVKRLCLGSKIFAVSVLVLMVLVKTLMLFDVMGILGILPNYFSGGEITRILSGIDGTPNYFSNAEIILIFVWADVISVSCAHRLLRAKFVSNMNAQEFESMWKQAVSDLKALG